MIVHRPTASGRQDLCSSLSIEAALKPQRLTSMPRFWLPGRWSMTLILLTLHRNRGQLHHFLSPLLWLCAFMTVSSGDGPSNGFDLEVDPIRSSSAIVTAPLGCTER